MSFLDPEQRSLYVDALRPPPGRVFDRAVATTYSLDLDTLLSLPLHLVLYAGETPRAELLQQGIALLDALRRTTRKLAVYCDRGRIAVPRAHRVLYSLLEPCLREVDLEAVGRGRGAFHPKVWLLRFVSPGGDGPPVYRLVVLTRNITGDVSWDLSLVTEGRPALGEAGAAARQQNVPLLEFLRALPPLSTRSGEGPAPDPVLREDHLEEMRRVAWDLPDGFDDLAFHSLQPGAPAWRPRRSDRLLVVSPFCGPSALEALADTSEDPAALVSRADTVGRIPVAVRGRYARVLTLHEAAETEDGEEVEPMDAAADQGQVPTGLHAKLYLLERDARVHLVLGSANATDAVMRANMNVEFLVEMEGPRRTGSGIDDFLGPDGMGDFLVDAEGLEVTEEDARLREVEALLDAGLRALRGAGPRIAFEADGELWRAELRLHSVPEWPEELGLRTWPVTLPPDRARAADALLAGEAVELGSLAPQSITTLLAFELRVRDGGEDERARFVLNLPAEGLPLEVREAALTRQIVNNQESFLRYLLLLLGDLDVETGRSELLGGLGFGDAGDGYIDFDELPILEEMARTYARAPDRLQAVRDLMERLRNGNQGDDVVPTEFMGLWEVLEAALEQET